MVIFFVNLGLMGFGNVYIFLRLFFGVVEVFLKVINLFIVVKYICFVELLIVIFCMLFDGKGELFFVKWSKVFCLFVER